VPDLTADYQAMRREVGAVRLTRDVVRAAGPDAASYLQGQLSQDLDGLADGASRWSFLLEPTGKVVAWLRVTAAGDDFLLDVDHGWGDAVAERLARFRLRMKVELDVEPQPWVAVRGPASEAVAVTGSRLPAGWPGLAGFDLLQALVPDGVPECSLDAYEAVRIEAGVPAMGRELTDATIPAEAGQWLVDAGVSFTKGCYTGQELVARIDSRGGNVPRRLRGVVVGTNEPPPAGATVEVDGKDVGALTSVAASVESPVALAYVHRSVDPPADATLRWNGADPARARIETLPLVS